MCAHQVVNAIVAGRVAERLPRNIYLKRGGSGFGQIPLVHYRLEYERVDSALF